ncbi:MAG: hypothetical protein M5U25_12440 [Planctomycetota bacterium]|nr:hypothetical protein [Planctomycetota bacterium]
MNEAAEKLGRLLVIARQARNPGAVFHELRQVNPASPELPRPASSRTVSAPMRPEPMTR